MKEESEGAELVTGDRIEDFVEEWMTAIDRNLSKTGVPIPDRVMLAAHYFVEHAVQDVQGDSKEEYLTRPWFRAIHAPIRKWYEAKYGSSLKRPENVLCGAVEIHGVPFQLSVPARLTRPAEEEGLSWFVFPVDVQPEDTPEDWVVNPPNFEQMSQSERDSVRLEIEEVGCSLRMIGCDLVTAKKPDDLSKELARNCFSHLMSAAECLIPGPSQSLSFSCWGAHQSVEQVLKLLDRQGRGEHQHTHDLKKLVEKVEGSVTQLDRSFIDILPSGKEITKIRAGDGTIPNQGEALKIYRSALKAVSQCCDSALNHKYRMRNAAFKLKKAPWL